MDGLGQARAALVLGEVRGVVEADHGLCFEGVWRHFLSFFHGTKVQRHGMASDAGMNLKGG